MWPRCSTREGSRCAPAITARCRSCGGSASSGPHARASRSSTPPTRSGTSWPPSPNCGRRCRRRSMGVSHPEPRDAFVSPRFGQVATFMLLPAAAIERHVGEILAHGAVPVSVGGDHSVTLPILRALARRHGPVGLVHFDAHPDTWDEYFGSKFFHGTPFRRAIEERLVDPRRMVQVGIRGPLYGADDFAFREQHGIEVVRTESVK